MPTTTQTPAAPKPTTTEIEMPCIHPDGSCDSCEGTGYHTESVAVCPRCKQPPTMVTVRPGVYVAEHCDVRGLLAYNEAGAYAEWHDIALGETAEVAA